MKILIDNPLYQTFVFGIIFVIFFLLFFQKKKKYTSLSYTRELKGFAILIIIFGHIGYFLSINQQFLFPFSVLSGMGVNLFLFLSGYGITFSHINKEEGIINFYKKRLLKLFVPFWIVLGILFLASTVFLEEVYSKGFITQSFLGIFTQADMFSDLNSPLWYFSLIVLYYVLFPLVYNKKRPWISALVLYFAVWGIVYFDPVKLSGIIGLYEVHLIAFPLGVLIAWLVFSKKHIFDSIKLLYQKHEKLMYSILLSGTLLFAGYFAINSGVGESASTEQWTSLLLMFIFLLLFLIKKRESKVFSLFGLYSYEIYLFHWPILYYYDFLYKNIPAWLSTILYLVLFIILAKILKKTSQKILKVLRV